MSAEHKPHSVRDALGLIEDFVAGHEVESEMDVWRAIQAVRDGIEEKERLRAAAVSEYLGLEEQLEAVEKREEVERIQGLTADDARKYIDQRDALVEQLEASQANERYLTNLLSWREKERNTAQNELAACRMGQGEALEQLETLREAAQEFVDAASVYGPERYDHAKRRLIAVLDSNPATSSALGPCSDSEAPASTRDGMASGAVPEGDDGEPRAEESSPARES